MITVFTSCYNQAVFLPQAIESVLRQTLEDFEYILIDDCSEDTTWDIIMSYAEKDSRIRPYSLAKAKNVGEVINHSVGLAHGNYWVWCPSDDKLQYNCLERKLEYAMAYPNSVIYDNWTIINDLNAVIDEVFVEPMTPEEFAKKVWETSPIGFTGIWIPTQILRDLPFPEHLQFSEDFYWMIKATIHQVAFVGMLDKLHFKRKHSNATTARNLPAILEQIPKIRAELLTYANVCRDES